MSVGSPYCCLRLKGRLDLNFFLAATLVCGETEHGIVVQARISSKLSPATNLQKHGRSFTGDRPVNSLTIQKTESEVHRAPVPRPNQQLMPAAVLHKRGSYSIASDTRSCIANIPPSTNTSHSLLPTLSLLSYNLISSSLERRIYQIISL